jgi:hypothetical protein
MRAIEEAELNKMVDGTRVYYVFRREGKIIQTKVGLKETLLLLLVTRKFTRALLRINTIKYSYFETSI